jgi:hypothetical protein
MWLQASVHLLFLALVLLRQCMLLLAHIYIYIHIVMKHASVNMHIVSQRRWNGCLLKTWNCVCLAQVFITRNYEICKNELIGHRAAVTSGGRLINRWRLSEAEVLLVPACRTVAPCPAVILFFHCQAYPVTCLKVFGFHVREKWP